MAKMRVWNENTYPLKDTFRGEPLVILPKEFIEMEEDDAILFRGQYTPMILRADKTPDPAHFKMLRLEKIDGTEMKIEKEPEHICQGCKYKATSAKDLEEHGKAMHSDSILVDEDAEKAIKAKKKAG